MIYDPAGSYDGKPRGTGDVLYDSDADLEGYIKYHQGLGSHVKIDDIPLGHEESKMLFSRIDQAETSANFGCAEHVSDVLSGVSSMKDVGIHSLPGSLRDHVRNVIKDINKKMMLMIHCWRKERLNLALCVLAILSGGFIFSESGFIRIVNREFNRGSTEAMTCFIVVYAIFMAITVRGRLAASVFPLYWLFLRLVSRAYCVAQ
jgi:hypothetical protein